MKYVDAHMHVNLKKDEPVKDIVDYIKQNKLEKAIIIINSRSEMEVILQEWSRFKNVWNSIEFVVGINKSDMFYKEMVTVLNEEDKRLNLKIHPRLARINADEIGWYMETVKALQPKVVMIDDFLYGNTVDEEIGVNMACAIAEEVPSVKVVLAHAGGVNLLRHVMRTKTYENIYYDISLSINYLRHSSVEKDMEWLLHFMWKRVMIGSDLPDFEIKDAVWEFKRKIQKIGLNKQQREAIMKDNAIKVYGGVQ